MGKQLRSLAPIHEFAARMKMEGRTYTEIEEEIGVKRKTLYKWFSDPLVKQKMTDLLGKIDQAFAERMASTGMAAMDAMLEMVRADHKDQLSPHQRLEVAREIMDRLPQLQKSPPPVEGESGHNIFVGGQQQIINPIKDMTDEELVAEARRLTKEAEEKALPSGG
jgi:hypothetical protein